VKICNVCLLSRCVSFSVLMGYDIVFRKKEQE